MPGCYCFRTNKHNQLKLSVSDSLQTMHSSLLAWRLDLGKLKLVVNSQIEKQKELSKVHHIQLKNALQSLQAKYLDREKDFEKEFESTKLKARGEIERLKNLLEGTNFI